MGGYETINDLGTEVRAGVLASLSDDERFLRAISCTDAIRSSRQTHLVLTDKRLLVFKPDADSYPFNAIGMSTIADVNYKKGILSRKLSVINSDGFSEEWDLDIDGADAFAEAVRNYPISSTDDVSIPTSTSSRATPSAHRQPSDVEFQTRTDRTPTDINSASSTGSWVDADNKSTTNSLPPAVADLSTSELRSRLQKMDDYGFEHFVAELWEKMDWNTTVSQASTDAGIDVVATKETPYPEKKVIQAKRYGQNTTVGGPAIQQYASLKHQVSGADSVIIVTTGSFTNAAEERARELNVKTVDGERLVAMIENLDARDLVAEYLDLPLYPRSSPEVAPDEDLSRSSDVTNFSSENVRYGSHSDQASNESQPNSSLSEDRSKADTGSVADDISVAIQNLTAQVTGDGMPSNKTNDSSIFDDPASKEPSTVGNWHYGIVGVTSILLLSLAASVSSLTSLLLLSLPVIMYLDIRNIRTATEDWQPSAWLYMIGAFFLFFLAVPVYLYRRNEAVGL